ncbi:MAG: amidohydrolase family protein [Rhodospirillales bacterium]
MKRNILLLLLSLGAAGVQANPPSTFAIRGARVVTVSGPTLEKGTVLIRDGLIHDVGANVDIPADAWVIDGQGLFVYPGLIDALSTLGLPEAAPAQAPAGQRRSPQEPQQTPARGPEDRPATTSWIRAADLISPADRRIESARNAGFTNAVIFPQRGIFAGQGAVIALAGEKPGDMVIATPAGMYLTLSGGGSGFPNSLMGVMAYIRQVYLDAEHYKLARQQYASRANGAQRPPYDRALEGVLETPRILLPASRAVEIERMLEFAAELKTPAVLYGGHEAYREADLLRKTGTPVLINLSWPERGREEDPERTDSLRILRLREHAPSSPAELAKAGCRFAFYTGGIPVRDLRKAVKRALDAGLTHAAAVRAFTLSPAEIYGVADRLGSIDRAKIANLVVTDGELFAEKTQIKYIFVDGVKYEPLPEPVEEREANR